MWVKDVGIFFDVRKVRRATRSPLIEVMWKLSLNHGWYWTTQIVCRRGWEVVYRVLGDCSQERQWHGRCGAVVILLLWMYRKVRERHGIIALKSLDMGKLRAPIWLGFFQQVCVFAVINSPRSASRDNACVGCVFAICIVGVEWQGRGFLIKIAGGFGLSYVLKYFLVSG